MSGRRLLLLAVLCSHFSVARAFTWEDSRDHFLGPGRSLGLQSCDQGRDFNARGLSYSGIRDSAIDQVVRAGKMTREQADASARGQQAAMKVLCPEVW